jgi:hypothetical protein
VFGVFTTICCALFTYNYGGSLMCPHVFIYRIDAPFPGKKKRKKELPGSLTYLSVWRLYYYMLRPIYIQLWRVFNVPSCFHLSHRCPLSSQWLSTVFSARRVFWTRKILRATGMRSHDSTGPEPTLYPLGQTRQLMKGKRKNDI